MRLLRPTGYLFAVLLLASSGCGAAPGDSDASADGVESGPAARAQVTGYRGVVLPQPIPKADFTLLDTQGEPFAFREETDGYVTLLFFGYTHCPDVCPVHLANLGAVLRNLDHQTRSRVRVVFVSTDPDRDTPERIREWLDAFDSRFIGLRGDLEEVNRIQARFGLPPASRPAEPRARSAALDSAIDSVPDPQVRSGGAAGEEEDYIVGHATQILAFTPDGFAHVVYPFGTRQVDWAHDLPRLVESDWAVQASLSGESEAVEGLSEAVPRGEADRAAPVRVSGVVVTEPIDGRPAAMYLRLHNPAVGDDRLVSASSPATERMEFHRQEVEDGRGSMVRVEEITVPGGEEVVLEPGGLHVMVHGMVPAFGAGDFFPVEFTFASGETIEARASIVAYADLEAALEGSVE